MGAHYLDGFLPGHRGWSISPQESFLVNSPFCRPVRLRLPSVSSLEFSKGEHKVGPDGKRGKSPKQNLKPRQSCRGWGGTCKAAHTGGQPPRAGLGFLRLCGRLCLTRLSWGENLTPAREPGNAVGKFSHRMQYPPATMTPSCWSLVQVAALLTQVTASSQ